MKSIREMFRLPGHSRRFYKYFFSYILLLLIVLFILGGLVYGSFISTLQEDVEQSNISALTQLKSTMDMRMREMERIAVNIYLDPDLRPYMVMGVGDDSIQAVRQLNKYKSGNEFLFDIALFHKYKDVEKIYTTSTVDNLDMYFKYIYNYSNWSKYDFLALIDNIKFPMMRPIETVRVDVSNTKSLATYIYPLPLNASKPYSFILFQIEDRVLKEMIKNVLKSYNGYIYIVDEKNNPIVYLTEGKTDIDALSILYSLDPGTLKQNISNMKIKGTNYSVVKISSDYNKWSYITVMQTDQFMKKVYTRRNIFNYVFSAVLIVGIIIAFVLAAGNYKPLRQLADTLTGKSNNKNVNRHVDEYNLISSAFDEVSRENIGLIKRLKTHEDVVKEQSLIKLLKTKPKDADEAAILKDSLSFEMDNPYFAVLIFLIDSCRTDNSTGRNIQNQVKMNMVNIIEELVQDIGQGYGVELVDEGGIALLLNQKAESGKERHISELAFKTKEYLKQHLNLTVTVGVGNTYDDFSMIHESYMEAIRAAYYRIIKGSNNVIFYEDLKEDQSKEYSYPSDAEKGLLIAIRQGKEDAAGEHISDIRSFTMCRAMSPESVQFIYYGIICSIIKMLDEIDVEIPDSLNQDRERLLVEPYETIDIVTDRLIAFCKKICKLIESQKESKNFELRDKILEVIKNQYMSKTLSLDSIAYECGASPSYISRFFKDQTGYPPTQYIDMLRMDKAKELLKNTNLPLKDIMDKVGYVDESNFIRKFKKKEGITPIQFRDIVQNDISS